MQTFDPRMNIQLSEKERKAFWRQSNSILRDFLPVLRRIQTMVPCAAKVNLEKNALALARHLNDIQLASKLDGAPLPGNEILQERKRYVHEGTPEEMKNARQHNAATRQGEPE